MRGIAALAVTLLLGTATARAQDAPTEEPATALEAAALSTPVDFDLERERASLDGLSRDFVGYYVGGSIFLTVGLGAAALGGVFMAVAGLSFGAFFAGLACFGGAVLFFEGATALFWSASRIEAYVGARREALEITFTPTEGGAFGSLALRF